jgi:hypothetical protein
MKRKRAEPATKGDLDRFATKDDLERFATKDDLERFATKDDLERFATKDDLKRFATKDDLKRFATKDDLAQFAKKDDLKRFPTKDEMTAVLRRQSLKIVSLETSMGTFRNDVISAIKGVESRMTKRMDTFMSNTMRVDRDNILLIHRIDKVEGLVSDLERRVP